LAFKDWNQGRPFNGLHGVMVGWKEVILWNKGGVAGSHTKLVRVFSFPVVLSGWLPRFFYFGLPVWRQFFGLFKFPRIKAGIFLFRSSIILDGVVLSDPRIRIWASPNRFWLGQSLSWAILFFSLKDVFPPLGWLLNSHFKGGVSLFWRVKFFPGDFWGKKFLPPTDFGRRGFLPP